MFKMSSTSLCVLSQPLVIKNSAQLRCDSLTGSVTNCPKSSTVWLSVQNVLGFRCISGGCLNKVTVEFYWKQNFFLHFLSLQKQWTNSYSAVNVTAACFIAKVIITISLCVIGVSVDPGDHWQSFCSRSDQATKRKFFGIELWPTLHFYGTVLKVI